jgi:hypothetical protein
MAETTKRQSLRSLPDLIEATESLFNRLNSGEIDSKTADAINTTLKSQSYFVAKLPMDALKIFVAAQIKKVRIPADLQKALPIQLRDSE